MVVGDHRTSAPPLRRSGHLQPPYKHPDKREGGKEGKEREGRREKRGREGGKREGGKREGSWFTSIIPFYDWIVPELQSGEFRIQQNLKSKIKLAKLTTKMHLIDL